MKRILSLLVVTSFFLTTSAQKSLIYIALVLDNASNSMLMNYAKQHNPWNDETKFYCHHMTILHHTNLTPELLQWARDHEGETFSATVTEVGYSDKAFALHVTETDVPSANVLKHVTLATHTAAGGSAYQSNAITDWQPLDYSMTLTGKITFMYNED